MATMTVTATASGSGSANGIMLKVYVFTGAYNSLRQQVTPGGGVNGAGSATVCPMQLPVTTRAAGSVVYAAAVNTTSAYTANGISLATDNYADTANSSWYGMFRSLSSTVTPGTLTYGASSPGTAGGAITLAEILPAPGMSLAEDPSAPATAVSTTGKSATTGVFEPPPGSLLFAMASANGTGAGGQVVQMAVTDTYPGGLGWTQWNGGGLATSPGAAYQFLADVPATAIVLSAAVF